MGGMVACLKAFGGFRGVIFDSQKFDDSVSVSTGQVKGIPEIPETEFLFVENSSTNSFKVCRDICAEVAKIDSEKSMIFTKQPHLIPDKHQSVELCGVDMEKNEAVKRFYDVKIIDDYSMTLRSYCNATREMLSLDCAHFSLFSCQM